MNNKTGVIGVNHLITLLVRLATQCDFDNPQKNTAHSKRKHAITSLTTAKEDLGIANIKVAARHKSDDAHRQYQQGAAPILHDRRIRAMWAANGGANEIEGKCLGAIEIACFAYYVIYNDFRTYVADAADERKPAAVDDRPTPERAASLSPHSSLSLSVWIPSAVPSLFPRTHPPITTAPTSLGNFAILNLHYCHIYY
jgi:hypothetical protein